MRKVDRSKKPIQFAAMTLPHKQLRSYPDVGDYQMNADNSPAVICAADTGDDRSNAAILIHEMVESILCWMHGVKEEDVTKFDRQWFEEQEKGMHAADDEPGHDPLSPYHEWHLVAERIEHEFVTQIGMLWQHHVDNVNKLHGT